MDLPLYENSLRGNSPRMMSLLKLFIQIYTKKYSTKCGLIKSIAKQRFTTINLLKCQFVFPSTDIFIRSTDYPSKNTQMM